MSERLGSDNDGSGATEWDSLREDENKRDNGKFEMAAREVTEEYKGKTEFEQKVMREVIAEESTRDSWTDWQMKPLNEKEIKNKLEYDFNFGMNCGGFALEMFVCVFSGSNNLEKAVKNITEKFPFVRVKGETELEPNEYEVIYRHAEGGLGHHFVKKVGDKILEKDGCQPVQEFEGWKSLEDAPEVTLAVNKNHEMIPRDKEGERVYSYII